MKEILDSVSLSLLPVGKQTKGKGSTWQSKTARSYKRNSSFFWKNSWRPV